ncbi:MAG: hypothetical protein JW974_02285 [Alphaproteobacteria bacterium]|nr:hypothetical protein [Alphaproteobacteria bacterium]MBN2674945.1 hypothetical protein [Alphaproteobacteria bacterium]
MFSKDWFFQLEKSLRDAGLDSDSKSFDEIKADLQNRKILYPEEFAIAAIYVILASGFSQKTAKKKHVEIINYLKKAGNLANQPELLQIFNNKNKTSAMLKIWQNQTEFCNNYYALSDLDSKLLYLSKLPHIGKITANHLARNLGENVVKYDIWIQRLGALYSRDSGLLEKIDNGNLNSDIKKACDDMFCHLESETGLPCGYIDVVLWKACQNKFIKL